MRRSGLAIILKDCIMAESHANLILVGYNRLFEEALKLLLEKRFNIVHETRSFTSASEYMETHGTGTDLVIGDPGINPLPEFEAISVITQKFPQTKVIVLTEWTSQALLEGTLRSGAAGFLSNDISVAALLYSIEIVLLGERIIPRMLPLGPMKMPSGSELSRSASFGRLEPTIPLSGREEQILHCLVDGMSNKQIARALDMTEATVKVHLKALLRKLQVQNRTQAAIWALNSGRHPAAPGEERAPDRSRTNGYLTQSSSGHAREGRPTRTAAFS
jgi:two-component system nitrate/nitrite response regulator NarL